MRTLLVLLLLLAAPSAWCDSLYQPDSFRALTADQRAYRVGDALTVLVVENSSASNSANTTTTKQGSVGFGSTLTPGNADRKGNLALNEDFTGKGSLSRSGKLLATMTVNVVGRAENGDLLIAGSQLIELNGEKQQIQIDGRVRPADITDNNTVLSQRIADAHISYIGEGILGEKQRPGILTRFLSWLHIL
jgi:flagellar L-ring protein precursor FlgH